LKRLFHKSFDGLRWQRVLRLCEKYSAIPPPTAAKESFERTLSSLILPRKISEDSVLSKYYLVASAAKCQMKASGLFTQPHDL
jgi:hypothetical protein